MKGRNKKILILLFLIFSIFFSFNVSASIEQGLYDKILVYLKMEDTASPVLDELGNVNYTCTDCPDFQQAGVINYSTEYTAANTDILTATANSIFNTGTAAAESAATSI